jgi:hypothetical protein
MKISNLILLFLSAFILFSTSCTKDNPTPSGKYSSGVFVINEGGFGSANGSISFLNRDSSSVETDIFLAANSRPLGDVVQSMTIIGDKAYIAVNNSNKVEVVNLADFKSVAVIQGITLPRYIVQVSDVKAYITTWDTAVCILDLGTNTISSKIKCAVGPDVMYKSGKDIYVLNSGGFGTGNTISVINSQEDSIIKTIVVADRPAGIVADKNGLLWVLCGGKGFNGWPAADDSKGALLAIDPTDYSVKHRIDFPETGIHPDKLVANKTADKLYFLYNNAVFSYDVSSNGSTFVKVRDVNNAYGLGFDKTSELLYVSNPLNFTSKGWIYRIKENGILLDSLQAEIAPSGFFFN